MDRDYEMAQIKAGVEAIMNHFGKYVLEVKADWPRCYIHKTEMCQVMKRGENSYFQCFEFDDECKPCGHREYSI